MKITIEDLIPGSFVIVNDKGNFYVGKIHGPFHNDLPGLGQLLEIWWTSEVEKEFLSMYFNCDIVNDINNNRWAFAKDEKSILVAKLTLKEI